MNYSCTTLLGHTLSSIWMCILCWVFFSPVSMCNYGTDKTMNFHRQNCLLSRNLNQPGGVVFILLIDSTMSLLLLLLHTRIFFLGVHNMMIIFSHVVCWCRWKRNRSENWRQWNPIIHQGENSHSRPQLFYSSLPQYFVWGLSQYFSRLEHATTYFEVS